MFKERKMVTATAKGTGNTTWGVWKQTNAALQGRKSKPALSTTEKFVRKNNLTHFVHRTTATGNLYVTCLRTGKEKVVTVGYSTGVKSKLVSSETISSRDFQFIGIDRLMQLSLNQKFSAYTFTFEELLYCQENPDLLKRLLDESVCGNKLSRHRGYPFCISIQKLVDDPSLLEPLPGEYTYEHPTSFSGYSKSVQKLLLEFFEQDCQNELAILDERSTDDEVVTRLESYVSFRMPKYLIWGDLLNRGLISEDTFKQSHKQGDF